MAMGQRRRTAAEVWPHKQEHPLDVFQRGRAGVAKIGDTQEAFEKARAILRAAPETAAERDELAKVLGRVLDKCRDFLKKKDYELYREAANRQEIAMLATEGK